MYCYRLWNKILKQSGGNSNNINRVQTEELVGNTTFSSHDKTFPQTYINNWRQQLLKQQHFLAKTEISEVAVGLATPMCIWLCIHSQSAERRQGACGRAAGEGGEVFFSFKFLPLLTEAAVCGV